MAMEGLWALVCATCLVADDHYATQPPRPGVDMVSATLAVQTAMQQGREHLLQNNPALAVEILESQLPRINGNAAYLALLRDAYRAQIKSLQLAKKDGEAQHYARRLAILEPPSPVTPARQIAVESSSGAPAPVNPPPPGKPSVFRMKGKDDNDFFKAPSDESPNRARAILALAEDAFHRQDYADANRLYDQAAQTEQAVVHSCRERWAYCKLHQVAEQLNGQSTAYAVLERDARAAQTLSSGTKVDDFARQILAEIEKRRAGGGTDHAEPAVALRDMGRNGEWSVAESANYRIFYRQTSDVVHRAAQVAERTRLTMFQKWFGAVPPEWSPKCAIYLHPTGTDYTRVTGVPASSPGHSSFQLEGGRVLDRRIDLHCDVPEMLSAVLPHEATHVVLAGSFGDRPVPRWADEGIAVLTEPREKIDRHFRNLPRHSQERQLFPLRELVHLNDYPQAQRVGVFYAQSVSLCDFLSREKGPQALVAFVRDGMQSGFDAALQRHYPYRSFEELEQRWSAWAFQGAGSTGVAQR
jgi:hypothetical protein